MNVMPANKLRLIPIEKVIELLENEEKFTLVEALSEEEFAEGHLPGAVNVPDTKVKELAEQRLPHKNALIVTYCSKYSCHASSNLARGLMELGYTDVLDYKAGKKGWLAAGFELGNE